MRPHPPPPRLSKNPPTTAGIECQTTQWRRHGVDMSTPLLAEDVADQLQHKCEQAVRVATQYATAPLIPRGRPSASRAAEQTQRSNTFPRRIRSHAVRCSRLTR